MSDAKQRLHLKLKCEKCELVGEIDCDDATVGINRLQQSHDILRPECAATATDIAPSRTPGGSA